MLRGTPAEVEAAPRAGHRRRRRGRRVHPLHGRPVRAGHPRRKHPEAGRGGKELRSIAGRRVKSESCSAARASREPRLSPAAAGGPLFGAPESGPVSGLPGVVKSRWMRLTKRGRALSAGRSRELADRCRRAAPRRAGSPRSPAFVDQRGLSATSCTASISFQPFTFAVSRVTLREVARNSVGAKGTTSHPTVYAG